MNSYSLTNNQNQTNIWNTIKVRVVTCLYIFENGQAVKVKFDTRGTRTNKDDSIIQYNKMQMI